MLSVVIIAWNEEKNLPRAMSSIKGLADEVVVVVDKASIDRTAEVAKKMGAKVYFHPHTGIVEPMRNFAVSKARGDWILLLDADEEVPAPLATKIKDLMSQKKGADYYRLPRKNIIFGRWVKSSHWWPDYVYRLFKKGSIQWHADIHSLPFTRGTGADLPAEEEVSLIHHNYQTLEQYLEQITRYSQYQSQVVRKNGYSFVWTDLITKPAAEFLRQFFAREAWREGVHGLALSALQSFAELVVYLRLWQESEFVPAEIDLKVLPGLGAGLTREFKWWYLQAQMTVAPWWKKIWLKLKRRVVL